MHKQILVMVALMMILILVMIISSDVGGFKDKV